VHVFGSSSMGALRAAELHQFGMRGVGQIFESYRDGELEDDDEVALIHGPQDMGYIGLSEPMVNIRATLKQAVSDGVLTAKLAGSLGDAAKATYYRERNWDVLLDLPHNKKKHASQMRAFRDWLADGKVDAKRDDALQMLSEIEDFAATDQPANTVSYTFEYTHLWHSVVEDTDTLPAMAAQQPGNPSASGILNELRLDPDTYYNVQREALLRLLALKEQRARGYQASNEELNDRVREFRLANALSKRKKLDAWLTRNDTDEAGILQMANDNALVDQLLVEAEGELDEHMLSTLRETGQFVKLRDKASKKARVAKQLRAQEDDEDRQGYGAGRLQLAAWHFEDCLEREMPADFNAYAQSIGLGSADEFFELLRIEYQYRQQAAGKSV
ncbi:MAG: TfuA domain-containing protein, partial [Pseudomonadota bacterium]